MKLLLRVVLIVDALMLLGFGALFLLTPWTSLYDALQLVQPQPAFVGQVLGVALLGLSWLAVRAAFDGAMTVPVGRVAGHINWISGVLMLVWMIGLHKPQLTAFGQLIAGGVGAWLIVIGFGGVRLAGAVRRREKAQAQTQGQTQSAGATTTQRGAKSEPRRESVTYAEPVFSGAAPASGGAQAQAAQPQPQPATGAAAQHSALSAEEARLAARDEAADPPRPPLHG